MSAMETLIESLCKELLQVLEAYPADPADREAWRTRVDNLRGDIERLKLISTLRNTEPATMVTVPTGFF